MIWRPSKPALLDAADQTACDAIIREGSKSFYAASLLLPATPRRAARALYAFCRFTDDWIDSDAGGRAACLTRRLDAVYAGRPVNHVADRAFAAVVEQYGIPREIPDALIEGFEWDEDGRRFDTIDEVLAYATRVASTVGVMMTLIMGCRDRAVLSRAADLGLAMQLTNIARDVGEDARMGRIYLPLDWLAEERIDIDEMLAAPNHSPALGRIVARLLDTAEYYYNRSRCGIAALPMSCRPAIRSAALIYNAIGLEIARHGFDSTSRRAVVSKNRKIGLIANAVLTPSLARRAAFEPTHASAMFLVEAAIRSAPMAAVAEPGGVERFIDLLASVEQRERQWYAVARGQA